MRHSTAMLLHLISPAAAAAAARIRARHTHAPPPPLGAGRIGKQLRHRRIPRRPRRRRLLSRASRRAAAAQRRAPLARSLVRASRLRPPRGPRANPPATTGGGGGAGAVLDPPTPIPTCRTTCPSSLCVSCPRSRHFEQLCTFMACSAKAWHVRFLARLTSAAPFRPGCAPAAPASTWTMFQDPLEPWSAEAHGQYSSRRRSMLYPARTCSTLISPHLPRMRDGLSRPRVLPREPHATSEASTACV